MTSEMLHDFIRETVQKIQNLETAAHRAGFHQTAHKLNEAKNQFGFEAADRIERDTEQAQETEE